MLALMLNVSPATARTSVSIGKDIAEMLDAVCCLVTLSAAVDAFL